LDVREGIPYDEYLELPTHVGRSKKKDFALIKDQVVKKIKGWLGRNLS